MGLVLGTFVSGLATRKTSEENEAKLEQTLSESVCLCADDLELTPAQREAIHRLLVLLVVKLGSSSEAKTLSLDELQRLAAVAGHDKIHP